MSLENELNKLETQVARSYERHSRQRVGLAAFVVGLSSIGSALGIYAVTGNATFGIFGFALAGLVAVNLAMLFIVPPASRLDQGKALICRAVRDRSRIRSADMNSVKLSGDDGEVRALSGFDLKVWRSVVVPFLIRQQTTGAHH